MFDSETKQRALQFLHIYCSDERSHSSAPESNKQNPRDRTLDLSIFFRYKHTPSLKNLPSPAPNESSPYWFQGNFAASFVFNLCLREFLLSTFAYCLDERSHSSAPESNKQNPRDRTLDLSIFFRYKHIPSLKNLPSPAPNESLPYWFQGNFAASFVFNLYLREFLLSTIANRFELRCEPKRLMPLYYKICPCCCQA